MTCTPSAREYPCVNSLNWLQVNILAVRDFEAQVTRHMVYFDRAEQVEWETVKE